MTCEEVFPLSLLGIPFFSVLMALSVHTVRADFFFSLICLTPLVTKRESGTAHSPLGK